MVSGVEEVVGLGVDLPFRLLIGEAGIEQGIGGVVVHLTFEIGVGAYAVLPAEMHVERELRQELQLHVGHQLMALSQGGRTKKLKYGHRGANQPVRDIKANRVYITSQNHGYAVVSEDLPDNAEVSFINGNDNTCEGVDYKDMPAFSVQFHPEACGGPLDTDFLFDRFIDMMNDNK